MKWVSKLLIVVSILGCKTEREINQNVEYLRWIGDIEHNNLIDNSDFGICNGENNVKQYFNVGEGPAVYVGEKPAVTKAFEAKYEPLLNKNQNGLIRIRFIVNCNGSAGRYRVLQADNDYNEIEFDDKIISQLLKITKGIDKWAILYDDEQNPIDYYNYLIFRITDGQITEILP